MRKRVAVHTYSGGMYDTVPTIVVKVLLEPTARLVPKSAFTHAVTSTHNFEKAEHDCDTGCQTRLTNLHVGVSPSVRRIFCGLRSRWTKGGVREGRWATASAQFVAHCIFVDTGMMTCPHNARKHTAARDIM